MEEKGVLVFDGAGAGPEQAGSASSWSLAHVANRPIAHHVLECFASAGIREVVVVLPAQLSHRVRRCLNGAISGQTLALRYVEHLGPLDLGGALSLSAAVIGRAACIVHPANGLLGEPLDGLMDRVRHEPADMVVIAHRDSAGTGALTNAEPRRPSVIEVASPQSGLHLAGICAFGPGGINRAAAIAPRGWADLPLKMIAEKITGPGGKLVVLPAGSWRRYAGDPLDLLELNRLALDRLDIDLPRPSVNGNRLEGRVSIHELASVRSSVIVGPAVIAAGARITDAYIGPYTSIGAGARIEGAEIERSIIAPGASVTHVGGRLVASVVGRNARVFRDFSLPRAMRLRVGDGTEVALC
jgi:glucose-1-phosphate thymidylyltransferase